MPLHQTCQLALWNFISQDRYIVNTKYMPSWELICRCSCSIYACCPSVTATNPAAVQTCILVECCCNMDACWTVVTQSACLPAFCHSILPLILLVWCLTISRACWLCLTIGHAFWCGALLSAVPVDVVLHYRSCLLLWYLTISYACWCGASL